MDKARKQTDKRLKTLENKIKKTFRDAAKELTETIETYFSKFEEADEKQKKRLSDGVITENQYKLWRINKIATGNRYKALRDKLANRMTQAGEIAMSYINDTMPFAYSVNREWQKNDIVKQGGKILKGIDFNLFDEATVKRLITKNPDLMPNYPKSKAIKRGIDLAYGRKQITKIITSSILQGKSIPNIAKDLIKSLPAMSMQSAIRTARTAITEAENAGRQDAADELASKGVIMQKEWIATAGKRTRKWHADADGQRVDNDKPFIVGSEKLMYPGDKSMGASGKNIYNCRCSSKRVVVGFKSTLTEEQQKKIKRVK